MEEVAKVLHKLFLNQKSVFITTEPGFPDFSVHASGNLSLITDNGSVSVSFNRDNLLELWGILSLSVFSGNYFLVSYGLHSFLSYVYFYTKNLLSCDFYDLKAIERFMGIYEPCPKTLQDALRRLKNLKEDKVWFHVWKGVYKPLINCVLPKIETAGLIHVPTRKAVFTHYEVEHQKQGRMDSFPFEQGFRAHGLGKNGDYKPRGEDFEFISFDYVGMEVSFLEYVSHCPMLTKAINSNEDVYSGIFQCVLGKPCPSQELRDFIKLSFLKVLFGMGSAGLAKELNVDQKTSSMIINKYYNTFPEAFNYVKSAVPSVSGIVRDVLGRPRFFEANDYVARNFVIQSPASMVCLEKLVMLSSELRNRADIVMHVHDSYTIACRKEMMKPIQDIAKGVLESQSNLCKGLKFKVATRVGPTLGQLMKLT